MRIRLLISVALLAGMFPARSVAEPSTPGVTMHLILSTPAFASGQPLPQRYAYQDRNLSPPLQWQGVPPAAQSLALICDDPDAPRGIWVHWVLYDLPPNIASLAENIPKVPVLANGAKQGLNDYQQLGYGGPCPPPGPPHRYFFKLYALDKVTGLPAGATKKDLLQAMTGHVLAQGQWMGTYQTQ